MSFLRLGALWALPLVLLPIVIHLLHRRRHPSQPWAAMMFIKRATQMRRGPAKLRRQLILAVRTLVVAAVVIAIARPLSSGMFGVAASQVASGAIALVVLDRSPSMQRRGADGVTRQAAACRRVAETLRTLQTQRVVLVDSVAGVPIELADVSFLTDPSVTSAADSSADIPKMLASATQYLQQRDQSVADIWICSDRRQSDWRPQSPLWKQIATTIDQLGRGVRLHVLQFDQERQANASVTVSDVRWVDSGQGRGPSISIAVATDDQETESVQARVSVGGVTKEVPIAMKSGEGQSNEVLLPVSSDQDSVFGQVSIDADVNAADDHWFFTAAENQNRPLGLLTDTPCVAL